MSHAPSDSGCTSEKKKIYTPLPPPDTICADDPRKRLTTDQAMMYQVVSAYFADPMYRMPGFETVTADSEEDGEDEEDGGEAGENEEKGLERKNGEMKGEEKNEEEKEGGKGEMVGMGNGGEKGEEKEMVGMGNGGEKGEEKEMKGEEEEEKGSEKKEESKDDKEGEEVEEKGEEIGEEQEMKDEEGQDKESEEETKGIEKGLEKKDKEDKAGEKEEDAEKDREENKVEDKGEKREDEMETDQTGEEERKEDEKDENEVEEKENDREGETKEVKKEREEGKDEGKGEIKGEEKEEKEGEERGESKDEKKGEAKDEEKAEAKDEEKVEVKGEEKEEVQGEAREGKEDKKDEEKQEYKEEGEEEKGEGRRKETPEGKKQGRGGKRKWNPELAEEEKYWLSYECILRYLRASKWQAKTAIGRLENTLRWRREFGVYDVITTTLISSQAETGKGVIFGYDAKGRPGLYMIPTRQGTAGGHRQTQFFIWLIERCVDLMPAGVETLAIFLNFAARSKQPSVSVVHRVLNILQEHYPEHMGVLLVINVPLIVNLFFKLIWPFIDPATREKIKFNPRVIQEGYARAEWLMTEWWGGEQNFEYVHEIYWPALVRMCEERREKRMARWQALGGVVGIREWEVRKE